MKKSKYVLVLAISIFVISLIVGLIYGINNKYDVSEYVKTINKSFLLINHLLVILLFFFSTISLIGTLICGFYIGFEGVCVGYVISEFFNTYGFKGVMYSLINITINKVLFLIILFYLFVVCVKYAKKVIFNMVGISTDYLIYLLRPLIKKYALIILFISIYDVLNYFFAYKVLRYFTFML